jgi:hypothetical protein
MCPTVQPQQGAGSQSPQQQPEHQAPTAPEAVQGVQAFRGRFSPQIPATAPTAGGEGSSGASTPAAAGQQERPPTAPEFPVLPAGISRADPLGGEGDEGGDDLLVPSVVSFGAIKAAPPKCSDCLEFFASDAGRCSVCAQIARGEAVPAKEETPADKVDDKMVLVGAAVVGAGLGALAGGLAAVVGAGAGAYAATRPQGDKVGETARYAGRGVVQSGEKISETAEKFASVASQRAREARIPERAAGARERLEEVAQHLDRRARQIDAEYNVTGKVAAASSTVQERARVAATKASSLVQWASHQAAAFRQPQGECMPDQGAGAKEEHC